MNRSPRRARERWPDFFLVGAARAGTSALFRLLGRHPDILTSCRKELHYFALGGRPARFRGPGTGQGINRWAEWRRDRYLSMFPSAPPGARLGEGSVSYLYYPEVAGRIRRQVEEARILVCLRDPAERAFSNFQYLRGLAREPLSRFADALDAEGARRRAGWEHIFFYRGLSDYHPQLRRYYREFGASRVHVVLHHDFRADPGRVLWRIFEFLGVDPSVPVDTDLEVNLSGAPRSRLLARALLSPNLLTRAVRPLVPPSARSPLERWVRRRLLRRDTPPRATVDRLRRELRPDVEALQRLIGRDLSRWISGPMASEARSEGETR